MSDFNFSTGIIMEKVALRDINKLALKHLFPKSPTKLNKLSSLLHKVSDNDKLCNGERLK